MVSDFFHHQDTFTAECHPCFGPATSFLLELLGIALCSFPVVHWTPTDGEFIFKCLLPYYTIHGVLQARILERVARPSSRYVWHSHFRSGEEMWSVLTQDVNRYVTLRGMMMQQRAAFTSEVYITTPLVRKSQSRRVRLPLCLCQETRRGVSLEKSKLPRSCSSY